MLDNKRIVITGANGVLGKAVTKKVIDSGASAILLDIKFDEDDVSPDEIERYEVDLLDYDHVAETVKDLGAVDGLLNLAGGFSMGPLVHEVSQQEWDFQFRINVDTLRHSVKAFVPKLLEQNSAAIVNVGALGALKGAPAMGAYCASKSAVMRLTESLSEELKGKGINVNAVLPSIIDTPANRSAMPNANPQEWVSPDDLANVICFLASDASRAVHGALIPVAGLS
ncbi:MAG: 3-oxoacyl-ACP reductase [Cellvibrionaceae bacterium]|nr:3-oxoacyl-ACP reductase [Cellvibrionaceae bacterium]|tara:strand:- start:9557 stop:10234 length:678 start_codon:yes stop_codon:yes gene_type:complete